MSPKRGEKRSILQSFLHVRFLFFHDRRLVGGGVGPRVSLSTGRGSGLMCHSQFLMGPPRERPFIRSRRVHKPVGRASMATHVTQDPERLSAALGRAYER